MERNAEVNEAMNWMKMECRDDCGLRLVLGGLRVGDEDEQGSSQQTKEKTYVDEKSWVSSLLTVVSSEVESEDAMS